ncbi:MAG: hypothetical protein E7539_04555 [Ruminococcaceae bacterium]|nr:hypothetical protein [Oscillospiraceae bacterium]
MIRFNISMIKSKPFYIPLF